MLPAIFSPMKGIIFLISFIIADTYSWEKIGIISITAGVIFIVQINFQLNIPMKIITSIFYPMVMVIGGVFKIDYNSFS